MDIRTLIVAAILMFSTISAYALTEEDKELVATTLNMNGHLCAEVVSVAVIDHLDKSGVIEAICIKYRGGNAYATYMIDMETGRAWVD